MRIPVQLTPASAGASTRSSEPVTFGVPLPCGRVQSPASWSLGPVTGPLRPVDTRILDRWPDGSARWVLVDAQIDTDGQPNQSWIIATDAAPATTDPGPSTTVQDTSDGLTIDTGAARFTFLRGHAFPFAGVTVGGRDVLDGAKSGLAMTGPSGEVARAKVDAVSIEHTSRLRTAVLVTGSLRTAEGRPLALEARVECFAGSAVARVRVTMRNPTRAQHPGNFWDLGDPGSLLFSDASLTLTLAGGGSALASGSVETGMPWEPFAAPVEIYQDSSGGDYWNSTNHINRKRVVPNTFRGYRVRQASGDRAGLRATPIVALDNGSNRITAAMPEFWQNFPRSLDVAGDQLHLRFFPGQYADDHELQGGEQKTHECFVGFGPDPVCAVALDWCRERTLVSPTAEWVLESGAVDFLAPLDAGHRALVDQAVEGPDRFEAKREVIDQFGWRHFGEIYGDHEAIGHKGTAPLVSHYNNQYDPIGGFALQFLRTGDRRWWTAMSELADHVIDIDIYHTVEDKAAYNGGLFWHTYHYGDADTCTHRTYPKKNTGTVHGGGPSADHNYPSGLALRYFLTGDDASRQAAVGLAEYVLNLDDWRLSPFRFLSRADTGRAIFTPPNFFGPARSSGNSLNALVDGHRLTGDSRFLTKADQLVRRVVHPKDDLKKSRLDEPEYRWFYAMFLQSLGKYLQHKAAIGQVDAAYAHGRASLLAYARWMAEHEYPYLEKPEKLEYPTETWAAQDIRKSDIFCYAAMHASGDERARFAERAEYFHRTSVTTLLGMPTRTLARPVIVLLTSGFLMPWFATHAATALPAPSGTQDFGDPERFVSQRTEAERRAKLIVAAGALVTVGSAIWALVWWLGR